jgi:hypothetical protein
MQLIIPEVFEAWIGGYIGPSYKAVLQEGSVVYEVYNKAYELHSRETIQPAPAAWQRFLQKVDDIGVWNWTSDYSLSTDKEEDTNWYVSVVHMGRTVASRGGTVYAPGFVEFLRAVRVLLDERPFA